MVLNKAKLQNFEGGTKMNLHFAMSPNDILLCANNKGEGQKVHILARA
jgi:hypothetical protein